MLIPSLQNQVLFLFEHSSDFRELVVPESSIVRQFRRGQPELGMRALGLNVNVRRLAPIQAGEEEPIAFVSQDGGHAFLSSVPLW